MVDHIIKSGLNMVDHIIKYGVVNAGDVESKIEMNSLLMFVASLLPQ
jgi:hypothetical protein